MASLTAASTPDQPAQTPPEHAAMASLELGASASPHVAHGGRGGVAPELAAGGGGTPQGAVRRVLRGTPRSAYSAASTPDRVIVGTPPTPMSERAITALALQSPASIPPPGPKSTPRGGPEVGVHKAAVAPPTPPASGGPAPASDKATCVLGGVCMPVLHLSAGVAARVIAMALWRVCCRPVHCLCRA